MANPNSEEAQKPVSVLFVCLGNICTLGEVAYNSAIQMTDSKQYQAARPWPKACSVT